MKYDGSDREQEEPEDPPCPICGGETHFVAHFAAPGVGQSWECEAGHAWVRISSTGALIDPREEVHILRPEDVR